ncbi:MAG: ribose-phosphate pyrophosphokinase [candidate division KSB1 bacterium]|nr:ribose-phosphate pyrophosphokinase [candidate division KSB1 bacterium]MDZ7318374.1 ribose-phosphate pyrophosphokinase [candidate division KSB1 bacterium]MDZ7341013.1 ribose-phosphate pyrophosphokinase [candidate division KSB1 bacterium]
MDNSLKIFAGNASLKLAEKIAAHLHLPLGDSTIRYFSDGEIWVKYNENIRGCDVFIIQSTGAPASNLVELLIMIDAARRSSARRITAVIPYFGYARQDRKDQPRVAITAKLVANLITTAGADRVLTMDLHAPQIQGFFDIPLDHLYSSPILTEYINSKKIEDLVVLSPDIGGVKMARAYAKRLHVPLAIVDKRRPKANLAEVMNLIGTVQGKNILLIDDIVDTAGTIIQAAEAARAEGAKNVYAGCTHPIFSGNAVERLKQANFSEIVVMDTIPLGEAKMFDKIKVLSVASLFGSAIKRIHNEESISILFD